MEITFFLGICTSYLLNHYLDRKIKLQKINEPSQLSSSPVKEPLLQTASQQETLKNPIEEKLEAAFENEIKSQKEEYSKIRSEEFWHKNHFEEKKEEKKETINLLPNNNLNLLPATPSISFEAYMGRSENEKIDIVKRSESIEDTKNDVMNTEKEEKTFENLIFEGVTGEMVKKEKIVGVAGGKPWLSSRKKN